MADIWESGDIQAKLRRLTPEMQEAFLKAVEFLYEKESSMMLQFIEESRDEMAETAGEIEREQEKLRAESRATTARVQTAHDRKAVYDYLKTRENPRTPNNVVNRLVIERDDSGIERSYQINTVNGYKNSGYSNKPSHRNGVSTPPRSVTSTPKKAAPPPPKSYPNISMPSSTNHARGYSEAESRESTPITKYKAQRVRSKSEESIFSISARDVSATQSSSRKGYTPPPRTSSAASTRSASDIEKEKDELFRSLLGADAKLESERERQANLVKKIKEKKQAKKIEKAEIVNELLEQAFVHQKKKKKEKELQAQKFKERLLEKKRKKENSTLSENDLVIDELDEEVEDYHKKKRDKEKKKDDVMVEIAEEEFNHKKDKKKKDKNKKDVALEIEDIEQPEEKPKKKKDRHKESSSVEIEVETLPEKHKSSKHKKDKHKDKIVDDAAETSRSSKKKSHKEEVVTLEEVEDEDRSSRKKKKNKDAEEDGEKKSKKKNHEIQEEVPVKDKKKNKKDKNKDKDLEIEVVDIEDEVNHNEKKKKK